jgi:acetyl esterase/lipase
MIRTQRGEPVPETFPSYAIDPELAPLLSALPDREPSDDFAQLRLETRQIVAHLPEPDLAGITVTDLTVPRHNSGPSVAVRLYIPDKPAVPVGVLFVHDGGFTTGDLDTAHEAAVPLCRSLGAVVVSVDYRLAPENPYPAGLEDCYAALRWFAGHAAEYGVDPARIAVRGGSAGGAACVQRCACRPETAAGRPSRSSTSEFPNWMTGWPPSARENSSTPPSSIVPSPS